MPFALLRGSGSTLLLRNFYFHWFWLVFFCLFASFFCLFLVVWFFFLAFYYFSLYALTAILNAGKTITNSSNYNVGIAHSFKCLFELVRDHLGSSVLKILKSFKIFKNYSYLKACHTTLSSFSKTAGDTILELPVPWLFVPLLAGRITGLSAVPIYTTTKFQHAAILKA